MHLQVVNPDHLTGRLLVIATNRVFHLLGEKLTKYLASYTFDVARNLQQVEKIEFEKIFSIESTRSMIEYMIQFASSNRTLEKSAKALFGMLNEYAKNERKDGK